MKPFRSTSAVALLLALSGLAGLPGCMQNDAKVTLLADGSGTVTDTIAVDLEKTKGLLETIRMLGMMPGAIPEDLDVGKMVEATYGKEALTAQLKALDGVEIKSVSSELKDGKRVASRDFAFASFDTLGATVFQFMTAELKKNDDGSFTLEMDALGAMRPFLSMGGGDAGGAGGMGFDAGAMVGMFAELIDELRAQQTFALPGTVVETNGTKGEDGRSVTWKFSIDDLKNLSPDAKNVPGKMSVRFQGEKLTLKPFKYAPNMSALSKRLSAPPPVTPGSAPEKAPEKAPGTAPEKEQEKPVTPEPVPLK